MNEKHKSNKSSCDCCEGLDNPSNNKWFFISALLIGLILGYALSFLLPAGGTTQGETAVKEDDKMKELIDDDAVRGNADAPVTIVEFSEYECPFCKKFYLGAYQEIKEKYIKIREMFIDTI